MKMTHSVLVMRNLNRRSLSPCLLIKFISINNKWYSKTCKRITNKIKNNMII